MGTVILGIGLVGYLFQVVPMARRVLFGIAGVALLFPFKQGMMIGATVNGIGLLLAVLLLIWEFRCRRLLKVSLSKEQLVSGDL